ncbi:MAG: hypothetical protein JST83_07520 [Bacteroidetes bacterium]|nr:hypothetical protein [Bacteroidota bacterium]
MKRLLLGAAIMLSLTVVGQKTPAQSFECIIGSEKTLTRAAISQGITRGNYEGYRLKSQRNTLVFDNGFEVVLLSAEEAVGKGLLTSAAGYPDAFPAEFKMPVFHMTPDGRTTAAYAVANSKYSTQNH